MAKPSKYLSHKNYRNSRPTVRLAAEAANFAINTTANATGKTVEGIFRHITTDRSALGRSLSNMPSMGFLDSAAYILTHFLVAVAGAVLSGILYFLLIALGIPFLITGTLPSIFAQ